MHRHDEDERIHLLFGSTHAPAIRGPWAQLLGSLVDRLSRFRLPLPPVGDRVAAWRSRISTARARFDRPIPGSRALAGFAALTGLAAVGWVGNIGWNPDDGAAIHPSPKAIDQPASDQAALRDTPDAPRTPIDDERLDVRRTTLGRGGTLDAALARVGVDESLRDGIQRAARRHLDPRRLPARMGITAAYDRSGALQRVSFRTELERYLKVSLRGPGTELVPRSEVLRLPVERDVESAGGRIERSVAQAFSNTPQGQQLTDVFADIFQWDVDLLVEPRPGDRVRMVYEAIRVGEVPDDLPAFGESPTRSGDFMGVGQVLAASYDGALAKSTG